MMSTQVVSHDCLAESVFVTQAARLLISLTLIAVILSNKVLESENK